MNDDMKGSNISKNQFRMSSRKSIKLSDQTMSDVNFCYLLSLFMTTALGTIQFGLALASWNVVNDAYYKRYKEYAGDHNADSVATLANTFLIIGIASGALSAGPLARFGRWKGIMITNIFVFLGNGLSLIPTFIPE